MAVLNAGPRAAVLLFAIGITACAAAQSVGDAASEADREVAWYEAELAKRPSSHPLYAQLGRALLDRARASRDPADLARARAVLARSLEIQPSYEALVLLAAAANFGHRFEDGKAHARRATRISQHESGADPHALGLLVEAHLGLGEYEEARRLLPEDGETDDFHVAAALGQCAGATGREAEALAAFERASAIAREANAPELVAWALVMAAGVYLDAGHPALAKPLLDRAAALDPQSVLLAIHRAELLEKEGHPAQALALYEEILARAPDAETGRRAFLLARALGRAADAERHLRDTERICLEAILAGEVYTLGELAQLWSDAGIHLDQARRLAEENLRYKRDAQARRTLEELAARAAKRP